MLNTSVQSSPYRVLGINLERQSPAGPAPLQIRAFCREERREYPGGARRIAVVVMGVFLGVVVVVGGIVCQGLGVGKGAGFGGGLSNSMARIVHVKCTVGCIDPTPTPSISFFNRYDQFSLSSVIDQFFQSLRSKIRIDLKILVREDGAVLRAHAPHWLIWCGILYTVYSIFRPHGNSAARQFWE